MKLAIHKRIGSYSDRWIEYCEQKSIPFKLVNCFDYDIISKLNDCNGLMWHWDQNDYKAVLFAKQLIFAIEKKGIKVFPNLNTVITFDDKVGQKYLLEAINAPLVNSYVFYSKEDSLKWINSTSFPKVFKLRGGAGSVNVSLVKSRNEGIKLAQKAFGNGFRSIDRWTRLKDKFWALKKNRNIFALKEFISSIKRFFILTEIEFFSPRQKGYIYFQDFIPSNYFDTRMVVVGNRCFGIRRYCRDGDFRASGSGILVYDNKLFSNELIEQSFEIARKLKTQSLALDFIWEGDNCKIVEISYAFAMGTSYDNCAGYWDKEFVWHDKQVNPQHFIIEDFIDEITDN